MSEDFQEHLEEVRKHVFERLEELSSGDHAEFMAFIGARPKELTPEEEEDAAYGAFAREAFLHAGCWPTIP